MHHRCRGSGNQAVIVTIVIVILLALLYIVFFNPFATEPASGTISPQQELPSSPERQTETDAEEPVTPESTQETDLPDQNTSENQATGESQATGEGQAMGEGQASPESANQEMPEGDISPETSPESASPEQGQEDVPSETRATAEQLQKDSSATKEYTVAEGDTLASIARAHNTTVTALVEENAIADPQKLSIGQRLTIPAQQDSDESPAAEKSPHTTYTVKPGDTLYSIARRYATTVEAMTDVNDLSNNFLIKGGQVLKLPPDASPVPK